MSFHIKGSYNSGFTSYTQASASVATYTPVLQEDGTIAYKKYGQNSQLKYEDKDPAKSRDWYMEAALNYARNSVTIMFQHYCYTISLRYIILVHILIFLVVWLV